MQDFSPAVAKAYYTSKARTGVGASRHCDLQNPSGYVEERITDWQEGKGFTIKIYESKAPLKSAFGRFMLRPIETVRFWHRFWSIRRGTVVTFTVDYQLKFGRLGALMDLLIARRQFQKGADALVSGLKHFVETGERVGERIPAPVAAWKGGHIDRAA